MQRSIQDGRPWASWASASPSPTFLLPLLPLKAPGAHRPPSAFCLPPATMRCLVSLALALLALEAALALAPAPALTLPGRPELPSLGRACGGGGAQEGPPGLPRPQVHPRHTAGPDMLVIGRAAQSGGGLPLGVPHSKRAGHCLENPRCHKAGPRPWTPGF